MNNRAVGTQYEEKAASYLLRHGYRILCKNFRCKIGEIDIIAENEGYLCFIEVKYRSGTVKGYPAEAITPNKIRKITHTAEYYMLVHNYPPDTACRFDAVVILEEEISIIKNAFGGM